MTREAYARYGNIYDISNINIIIRDLFFPYLIYHDMRLYFFHNNC